MTSQPMNDQVENYLSRLEMAIAKTSAQDKQDIVREIRAHIADSIAGSGDRQAAVGRVLGLLGTPEQLALRYSTECQLTRASRSFSPWLLLRTSWSWAKTGVKGTLAFLIALFGYAMALGLTISLFIKPFMPSRIGLWIGPEGFNLGMPSHPELMHELLGKYFIPVIAVAAFAFAIGTTHALRWMIRKRSPRQRYAMTEASLSA